MTKKISLLLAVIFMCFRISAQSPFTKFIEQKEIQWAAVQSSNIRFENVNLNLLLRKKLQNNSIKAALIDQPENFSNLEYRTKQDILKRIYPGYEEGRDIPDDSLFSAVHFNKETGETVEVQQVFYITNGLIKSIATMASPKFRVVTSKGTELGVGNAFTSSFNKKRSIKKSWKKKAISLGKVISTPENLLIQKQLYGQDLLKTIWPYLNNNHYKIINISADTIIKKEDINLTLLNAADSASIDFALQQVPLLSANAVSISAIEQAWFYNEKKNILFSTISSLLLSVQGRPLLKIVIK